MTADARRFRPAEHLGFMAGIAFLVVVLPKQRKCGQIMIEPRCFFPARLRVTVLALITLLAIVHFVFKMARGTGGAWRCIENWFNVTIDAGNRLMRSVQYKFGVFVVIEMGRGPFIVLMTATAIGTVMAIMVVIFEVATDTSHIHFIGKRIRGVTIIASQLGVTTQKREISIARVIKTRIVPVRRVVAVLALFAAASIVRIIVGVTTKAVLRRVLEDLGFVAAQAICVGVFADQGIICGVVIELYFEPVSFVMAVRTFRPETVLVYVVF